MTRILVKAGVAFLLILTAISIGVGYLGVKAIGAASENRDFAVAAVREVATDWSFYGRDRVFAQSLIRQANSREGRDAVRTMSRLGELVSADAVSQSQFGVDLVEGTTATVTFEGQFENGTSFVTVKLQRIDGRMKVRFLDLRKIVVKQRAVTDRA